MSDTVAAADRVDVEFGDDGLVPAVAQDADSKAILMLAYVTPDALEKTLETGRAHYYSRSREELWEKGASSGHTQTIREVRVDCDADTLLYLVEQRQQLTGRMVVAESLECGPNGRVVAVNTLP